MRWCSLGLFALLVLAAELLVTPRVLAQGEVPLGQFSAMRYTPAVGPGNYFMVEGASTPGHLQGSVGLVLDYGHLPFVLYDASCRPDGTDCMVDGSRSELVQYIAAGHITGSVTLFDRIQIGLVAPLILTSGEEFNYTMGRFLIDIPGGQAFAVADPRLSVKGHIFRDTSSGIALGASAFVTFPTGAHATTRSGRFVGDALPTFGGHFIFEMVTSGFHVAFNAGGQWREEVTIFSTVVGPQITWGAAVGYDVTPLFGLFAEANAAHTFTPQIDEHYLEWRAGGRLRIEDFDIHLAGGTGLPPFGVGTPLFRVLAGFQWAPMHADQDGDGIDDSVDSCPSEAEDMDGWEDEDGCPDRDNDGDGLLDGDDPCPDEAEDEDGFEDDDGCPDRDNDGDGIPDGYDSCPNEPEDMDGDRDEDGCPDNDTDRDGIDDDVDQCPNEPEDFDGFGDEDGCPETDFDGDGIDDENDACPDQAEDMDGFEDEDGCPEEGGPPAAQPEPRRRRRGR